MKRTHAKLRGGIVAGLGLLTALGQAQGTAQTDVTVPTPTTSVNAIFRLSLTTTLISDTDLITASGNNFTLPTLANIQFDYNLSILVASTQPFGGSALRQGERDYVQSIKTSVDAMNRCIDKLKKGTVGLDVYNLLVSEHRKALRASLAWAKYLREHGSTSGQVDALAQLVPQLEGVGKYTTAVNSALTRA